jgi:hypothetical protein
VEMAFTAVKVAANAYKDVAMPRLILTPSTNPAAPPAPDPLLAFIQHAQLTLVYRSAR